MSEELLHEQTQTEAAVTMADLEEHFDDANPWNVVKSYMEKGTILPVKVEGIVNGGAIAMIEGIRGFIPASRLSLSYIEDLETYLLKDIEVRVIDVDEANNRLVLSAREILQEKARKEREARIAAVKVGSIVTGTVESLQNYGAFVDLGDGLSGLVHISQISLKRIKSPSDVLNVGDEVNVKIIGVKDGKISLSMKALEEKEFTATAGGGAVEVTISGKREVTKVKLAEEVVDPDDIEMLEDLIVAATNEALRKVEEESTAVMSKLTGGLGGLGGGLPF